MGIDIYEEAVRLACGQDRRRPRPTPHTHMKMRYFLPDRAGRLIAVDGLDAVRRDPRVSELVVDAALGDPVLVPPDGYEFLGYVSVVGDTADTAAATLEEIHGAVRFRIQPPGAAVEAAVAAGAAP
jgi:biotin carboxylase